MRLKATSVCYSARFLIVFFSAPSPCSPLFVTNNAQPVLSLVIPTTGEQLRTVVPGEDWPRLTYDPPQTDGLFFSRDSNTLWILKAKFSLLRCVCNLYFSDALVALCEATLCRPRIFLLLYFSCSRRSNTSMRRSR
jgi:hypothetical protein